MPTEVLSGLYFACMLINLPDFFFSFAGFELFILLPLCLFIFHVFLSVYVSAFPPLVELRENLQKFVEETNQRRPDFIKMVRHTRQEGLIRARVSGWRAASAPVVALFDAHVEFNVGW